MSNKLLTKIEKSLRGQFGYEETMKWAREASGHAASANSADYLLGIAIKCFIADLANHAHDLLGITEGWLIKGVEVGAQSRDEFPHFDDASLFHNLALCRWLLHAHQIGRASCRERV